MATVENIGLEQARAGILQRRRELEAERARVWVQMAALRRERTEAEQEIKSANRQRRPVPDGLKQRLRELEELIGTDPRAVYGGQGQLLRFVQDELGDLGEQLAGIETDLSLTYNGPEGSAALVERYRPELVALARAASADEAAKLATLIAAWDDYADAHDKSVREWVQAFGVAPGRAGVDAHLAQSNHLGGVPARGFDARIPGSAPSDTVVIYAKPLDVGFVGGRAGTRWQPRKLLEDIIVQMRGRSCQPAALVSDPRAGEPGVYRRVLDHNQRILDEKALRAGMRDQVTGEFSAWQYVRELTPADLETLRLNRDADAEWRAGNPHPESVTTVQVGPGSEPPAGDQIADDEHLKAGNFIERDGKVYLVLDDGTEIEVDE